MGRCALITGITGQDGSYLAELLLEKGYTVYGLVRRSSSLTLDRIAHLLDCVELIQGDLLDQSSLCEALQIAAPDEVYNLASMSHVGTSFSQPVATGEITGLGAVRLLEALRMSGGQSRFYQASTSEIIGQADQEVFRPRSPYGCAKLYAHMSTINYRESYGMYACCGILYNHESPRRGLDFVTRKITHGFARIAAGLQEKIVLGNLYIKRDWGFAGDYVEAMYLMLQRESPKDYVIATGVTHSLAEFLKKVQECTGLSGTWREYVLLDESEQRPSDVVYLRGDASAAISELEWRPRVNFEQLVEMMVEHDLREVRNATITGPLTESYRA